MTKRVFFLLLAAVLLTSCYSYKVFPREYRNFTYTGKRDTAFVLNPGLKKEYRILEHAGIFTLTSDSTNATAKRIQLQPMGRGFVCGQPIIASAFTLGQLPVYFPDRYTFRFDEILNGDSTHHEYELLVAQRVWFWDLFSFRKKFPHKAGQALLANYYHQQATTSGEGR